MAFSEASNGIRKIVMVAVVLALFSTGITWASGSRDFVQIRVETGKENVTIEMPYRLLEYLESHSKGSCDLGKVEGADLKLKLGDLLKVAKEKKSGDKEILAFEATDEAGKKARFYLKTSERKAPAKSAKPTKITFSVKDKGDKDAVTLSFSVESANSFAGKLDSGDGGSSDFGPFLKSCLSAAAELGQGPIVRIVAKDGEIGLYLE